VSLYTHPEVDAVNPPTSDAPQEQHEWWRDTLIGRLEARRQLCDIYEDYYEGRHTLAFVPAKLREQVGHLLASTADNYLAMVVQASVERLAVQGFQTPGQPKADQDAWNIWQENLLDETEPQLWTESAKHGESYLLVWKDTTDDFPRITLEHPLEFIVARDPDDRNRIAAALKCWQTDWGTELVTLYLPGEVYRWQRDGEGGWVERTQVDFRGTLPAEVGVPVVPIVNTPAMLAQRPPRALIEWPHMVGEEAHVGLGRSDYADVIGTQDSINGCIVDAITASKWQGFRLRYAIGVEAAKDEHGNDIEPEISPGALMLINYDKDQDPAPQIGDLGAADLGQFIDLIVQRIQSLSSRTRIPVHYLLSGRVQLPSGEALAAAEAGLSMKITGKKKAGGPALGRAISLAFAWMNDPRAEQRFMPQFAQHEYSTEAALADAVAKRSQALGIPQKQAWRDVGYTDDQITAMEKMVEDQLREAKRRADEYGITPDKPADPSHPGAPAPEAPVNTPAG
jgi:Phage portal protein, SPP1 Gp6-like